MKLLIPLIALLLFSCKKDDCSSDVKTLDSEDVTVVVGWPINLKTEYISTTVTNKWSGPNNWKTTTTEGIPEVKVINEANFSHTGSYSSDSYTYGDCLAQTKKINVHVIAPPHAPCSIDMNTAKISSPFTYEANYSQITHYIEGNNFVVKAQNGLLETLTVKFPTNGQEPKPGIQRAYVEFTSNQTPYYQYQLDDEDVIYLQKINNQLIISFCNAIFFSFGDVETNVLISTEIVVP